MSGLVIAAGVLVVLSIALLGLGLGFDWWPFAAWTALCVMVAVWLAVTQSWEDGDNLFGPSRDWTLALLTALGLFVWPMGLLVVWFISGITSWLIRRLRGERVEARG
jgi:hypothetical protein